SRLGVRDERPDQIIATNGVVIEWLRSDQSGRATGEAAVYLAGQEGEEITLSGAPAWEFGKVRGSARELVLYPTRESYRAQGEARMALETPLLTGGRAPSPDAESSAPLEIA